MCRLIETIKICQCCYLNLKLHEKRLNISRKDIFKSTDCINISQSIEFPENLTEDIYKCRIIYGKNIEHYEFIPYVKREINSLKIVYDDDIEYNHKFEERNQFNNLFNLREHCSDILIVKRNLITDTSFSNIVFFNGNKWITPAHPLLKGTKREQLLNEGKIKKEEIMIADLKRFKKASIINAMLELGEIEILIENIIE